MQLISKIIDHALFATMAVNLAGVCWLMVTIIVLGLVPGVPHAQAATTGFIEPYIETARPKTLSMDMGIGYTFDDFWGVSAFGLVADGWAEMYLGPTVTPTPWLALGLSAGIQQGNGVEARYAASIFTDASPFTFFGVVEWDNHGKNGVWYDLLPQVAVTDWFSCGLRARRFIGTGPYLSFKIPKTPFSVWGSWNPWDPEHPKDTDNRHGLAAVVLSF